MNTLTRRVEAVTCHEPGRLRMYSCGPTVYRYAHVGNLRTFMLADLIRRTLTYHGVDVTSVMNITDVGHMTDELTDSGRDRMELAATDEGRSPQEIADFYTQAFLTDCDAVNIKRFDVYPKASDHIPQMLELIVKLIERGHAYVVDGTVYYDVTTFESYGRLANQQLDAMQSGHRMDIDQAKRHPQDFLLWKAAGPDRLVTFESPWGIGYPGWHIECSAMSMHLLGEQFEIHTGGVDNIFPHHTDEIAQSEGATGCAVVDIWVHGDHLLMGQAKMAKSSGNVVTVANLRESGIDPLALRYLCLTARYRRQTGFTLEALEASGTALRRLREHLVTLSVDGPRGDVLATDYETRFIQAVDDDLDFPQALTVLQQMVKDTGLSGPQRCELAARWDTILGLDLVGSGELESHLSKLIEDRQIARDTGNWAEADRLRDELGVAGIEVIDTAEGPRWTRRDS